MLRPIPSASITDATALGALSGITDPAFLLVGSAAGTAVRKLVPTGWGLSNLLVTVPAGRVPYSHADGTVTSSAGLTYDATTGAMRSGRFQSDTGLSAFIPGGTAYLDFAGSDIRYRNTVAGYATTHYFPGTGGLINTAAGQIGWASTSNAFSGTLDTGLARDSAGVVRVSDGSTGYGDLKLKAAELVKSATNSALAENDLLTHTNVLSTGGSAYLIQRYVGGVGYRLYSNASVGYGSRLDADAGINVTGSLTAKDSGGTSRILLNPSDGGSGRLVLSRIDVAPLTDGVGMGLSIRDGNSFVRLASDWSVAWTAGDADASQDTELTRSSAGFVGIGSTTNKVVIGHNNTDSNIKSSAGNLQLEVLTNGQAVDVWGPETSHSLRMRSRVNDVIVGAILTGNGELKFPLGGTVGWSATNGVAGTNDTEINRNAAGFVGIGSPSNKVTVGHDGTFARLTGGIYLLLRSASSGGTWIEDTLNVGTYPFSGGNINASRFGFAAAGSQTIDAALARNAAGVVEINNGTAGQYRDLMLRNLTANEVLTVGGFTVNANINQATVSPGMSVSDAITGYWSVYQGFKVSTAAQYGFTGSGNSVAANELAIRRHDANTVAIDNGTAGQYRDLMLRTLTASGRSVIGATNNNQAGLEVSAIGGGYSARFNSVAAFVGNIEFTSDSTGPQFSGAGIIRNLSSLSFDNAAGVTSATVGSTGGWRFNAPTVSDVPLTVRGAASQTANLTEWQTNTPTTVASVSAAGLGTFAQIEVAGSSGLTPFRVSNGSSYCFTVTAGGAVTIGGSGSTGGLYVSSSTLELMDCGVNYTGTRLKAYSTTTVPLKVQGLASHSGNLTEWDVNGGAAVASVSAAGLGTFAGVTSTGDVTIGTIASGVSAPLRVKVDGGGNGLLIEYSATDYTRFLSGGVQKGFTCAGATPFRIDTPDAIELMCSSVTRIKTDATGIGFYGVAPVARQTVAAAATDPATTMALVNELRAALIALGAVQ